MFLLQSLTTTTVNFNDRGPEGFLWTHDFKLLHPLVAMPKRSQPLPHPPLSPSVQTASISGPSTTFSSTLTLHSRRQLTSAEKYSHLIDNDIRDLVLHLPRSFSQQNLTGVDLTTPIHNSAHGRYDELPRRSSDGSINVSSSNHARRLSAEDVLHAQPLPLPLTVGSEKKPGLPAGANGGIRQDAYPLPSPNEGVNRGQNDKGSGWDREKGKTIELERLKEDWKQDEKSSSPVDFSSGRSSTLQDTQSPGPRKSIDHTKTPRNRNHPNLGVQVPINSASPSSYTSPVLSPRRMNTGEFFSSSPYQMTQQLWSPPEIPHRDVHSGFPFTSLQEKAQFGLDYSPLQSPQAPNPKRVRNSRTRPTSPVHLALFSNTSKIHHENNGNTIDAHLRPLSKSRPTSPVHPRLFFDTPMLRQENNYNMNVHPLPRSMSHPTSPVSTRFPADTSMVRHENSTAENGHPLPIPPSAKTPVHSSPVSPIIPKPKLLNQWSKAKFIGRGTYGSVFEATNKETGSMCAMKEVELCPDDPMAVRCMKQLEQEIEVLSHLKHPNIVQYYGSEIVDDKFYIYLELVYPGSINKYIRETALTESVVRNFTRHILCGLAYLHSTMTIHRDIKAANLLVDAYGVVKLADFGMAKHLTEQATELSLKGSPYWMAPELMQAVMQKDKSPDFALAVDIWSLGCTVIEMFTGRPPWHEYEGAAAMFKVLTETPPLPENLSEDGKHFLQCCFRRNPAERPSASMLLQHPFVRIFHPVDVPTNTQSPKGSSYNEIGCYRRDLATHMLDQRVTISSRSRELWEKGFI